MREEGRTKRYFSGKLNRRNRIYLPADAFASSEFFDWDDTVVETRRLEKRNEMDEYYDVYTRIYNEKDMKEKRRVSRLITRGRFAGRRRRRRYAHTLALSHQAPLNF